MRGAVDAGFEEGTRHLTEAARLAKDLDANWPQDPMKVYELVCLLARQQPAAATIKTALK